MAGLLLAALLAVPAVAASPHPAQVRKAEPRRVVEYHPNRRFTADTDLVSASGYAAWMIDELLHETTPLPPLGAAFMRAERDTGINARYLVAHAILETGWGTSWIALQKHNLFGYGAFDRDPARYALRFPSFAAGISYVADEIRAAYLSPDGRWWRGFPTLRGVNRFYASDPFWADKIVVLANAIDQVVLTLRERGLQFGPPRLTTPAAGAAVAAGVAVHEDDLVGDPQLGGASAGPVGEHRADVHANTGDAVVARPGAEHLARSACQVKRARPGRQVQRLARPSAASGSSVSGLWMRWLLSRMVRMRGRSTGGPSSV